ALLPVCRPARGRGPAQGRQGRESPLGVYLALEPPYLRLSVGHGRVNLRAVQELDGWRTFSMVGRYSHLAPDFLGDAVERLVGPGNGGGTIPKLARREGEHGRPVDVCYKSSNPYAEGWPSPVEGVRLEIG